jgi:N-formylglutamate amidohydrolase
LFPGARDGFIRKSIAPPNAARSRRIWLRLSFVIITEISVTLLTLHPKELRMFSRGLIAFLALFLGLLLNPPPSQAADTTPANLVLVQQGSLPIILTAPHGGREAIAGVAPRTAQDRGKIEASRKWGGFDTRHDVNTDILVQGIAAEIEMLTGNKPYLVMAKFDRKYIDANRPPEIGLDDPNARPYYDYYHNAVRIFIDDVRRKYPAGLLIDVHGQRKDRGVVMRGTRNGRTITQLLQRAGVSAVTGSNGVFGQLEANGFKVFPDNDVPPAGTGENAGYHGGYTVSIYGSHITNGIDAVQLEFGDKYLAKIVLDNSARNAAWAIVAFHEAYLKEVAIK